jgi:hypothetical protein
MNRAGVSPDVEVAREVYGVVAEFADVGALRRACEAVRDAGFTQWDAHTPFPVHGLDKAMGLRRTKLPWIVFGGGATGCAGALLMQWWMNAVNFPFIISGKPFFSLPANIPIVFELTVLFASFAAVLGMLALNWLPELYHPLFKSERFRRVTNDRFFISIEAKDPKYDADRTRAWLESLGAESVEVLET